MSGLEIIVIYGDCPISATNNIEEEVIMSLLEIAAGVMILGIFIYIVCTADWSNLFR